VIAPDRPEKSETSTFARAITQAEFGRFYWDDQRAQEMGRSMAAAKARVKEAVRKARRLQREREVRARNVKR